MMSREEQMKEFSRNTANPDYIRPKKRRVLFSGRDNDFEKEN
jgi:hypothetical protein